MSSSSDTIGGIIVTEHQMFVATSSGGPSGKLPGRVGSAAIRGSGFDFKCEELDGSVAALATGHGENIIESRTSQLAL